MPKTAILIAMFFPSTLFAAIPVLTPSTQTQQSEQSQSASLIGTHRAGVFDQLSMGPDPGGNPATPLRRPQARQVSRAPMERMPPINLAQAALPPRPAVPRS